MKTNKESMFWRFLYLFINKKTWSKGSMEDFYIYSWTGSDLRMRLSLQTRKVEWHYNLSFMNQEQNVFLVYKCWGRG